jgi:hypothetical protein
MAAAAVVKDIQHRSKKVQSGVLELSQARMRLRQIGQHGRRQQGRSHRALGGERGGYLMNRTLDFAAGGQDEAPHHETGLPRASIRIARALQRFDDCLSKILQSERRPLVRPSHWKVH